MKASKPKKFVKCYRKYWRKLAGNLDGSCKKEIQSEAKAKCYDAMNHKLKDLKIFRQAPVATDEQYMEAEQAMGSSISMEKWQYILEECEDLCDFNEDGSGSGSGTGSESSSTSSTSGTDTSGTNSTGSNSSGSDSMSNSGTGTNTTGTNTTGTNTTGTNTTGTNTTGTNTTGTSTTGTTGTNTSSTSGSLPDGNTQPPDTSNTGTDCEDILFCF